MAELAAPPAYDDVVSPQEAAGQPSAPPRQDIIQDVVQEEVHYPRRHSSQTPERRRSSGPRGNTIQSSKLERFINRYISYSIARHLRRHVEPKSEQQDPELDVEAQFSRQVVRSAQMAIEKKRRLQCISGWLWCIGVILVLIYIAVPVAMIAIGSVGAGLGKCPFRSNTIVVYLIGGGIILSILILIRVLPSVMTCIRNRNYCNTKSSNAWGGCICAAESFFYIMMIINFIVLILGTYTTFADVSPTSCSLSPASAPDCCDSFVYISSAFLTVFQYVLYLSTGLFVCLVLSCIRSMDKEVDTQSSSL